MYNRKETKTVFVGSVPVGGDNPISVAVDDECSLRRTLKTR